MSRSCREQCFLSAREFSAIIVRGKIAVERHHNAGMTKPHLNGLGWKL